MLTYLSREEAGEFSVVETGETGGTEAGFTWGVSQGPYSFSSTNSASGTAESPGSTGTSDSTYTGITSAPGSTITSSWSSTGGEGDPVSKTFTFTASSSSSYGNTQSTTLTSTITTTGATSPITTNASYAASGSTDDDGISGGTTDGATFLSSDTDGDPEMSATSTETTQSDSFSTLSIGAPTTATITFTTTATTVFTSTATGTIPTYSTTTASTYTTVGGSATTTLTTVGTSASSSVSTTYTYASLDTNTDNTTLATSLGLTTTSLSLGYTDQYQWDTVFVDDGISDAWILTATGGPSIYTELYMKVSIDATVTFGPFLEVSDFPQVTVDSDDGTATTGETGTEPTSSTEMSGITTANDPPLSGARQSLIGTSPAPSDTRPTVNTTVSTVVSGVSTTGSTGYLSDTYSTTTQLSSSTYTTSFVTTAPDPQASDALFLAGSSAQAFTVTTTSSSAFSAWSTATLSNAYPCLATSYDDGDETSAGGLTSTYNNFPQTSALLDLSPITPARYVADAPVGFAPFGAFSTSGNTLFRDIAASFISLGSANLNPASDIEAMSFMPWGILQLFPALDYGLAVTEQTALTGIVAYRQRIPISIYTSKTLSTAATWEPTSALNFSTVGSALILSSTDSALTLGLSIPFTTTRTTSNTNAPSTMNAVDVATMQVGLGLSQMQSDLSFCHQGVAGLQGGTPCDGARADTLQYFGQAVGRTLNDSTGGSTTEQASFTNLSVETAPTTALVYESSSSLLLAVGGGPGLVIDQYPRFYSAASNPSLSVTPG